MQPAMPAAYAWYRAYAAGIRRESPHSNAGYRVAIRRVCAVYLAIAQYARAIFHDISRRFQKN